MIVSDTRSELRWDCLGRFALSAKAPPDSIACPGHRLIDGDPLKLGKACFHEHQVCNCGTTCPPMATPLVQRGFSGSFFGPLGKPQYIPAVSHLISC